MIYYTIVPPETHGGLSTFSSSPALFEVLQLVSMMGVMSEGSDYIASTYNRMTIHYD